MDSICFSFFSGISVLTLALCARLSWLLVSFYVHIKSLHIVIIIIIIKYLIVTFRFKLDIFIFCALILYCLTAVRLFSIKN